MSTLIEASAPAPHPDMIGALEMWRTATVDGRLLQTVDANRGAVEYRHDGAGNVVLIEGTTGVQTKASYNALGLRTSSHDPDRGEWSFTYTAAGELYRQIDARGICRAWTLDRLGRVTEERHRQGGTCDATPANAWTKDISYAYDTAKKGLPSETRRFAADRQSEALHVQAFQYDALSRPLKETVTLQDKRYPDQPFHNINNNYWSYGTWRREWSYDRHYGWVKQMYRGPDAAHPITGTRAHTGGIAHYLLRDRYGHLLEEGLQRSWDTQSQRMYGRRIAELDAWGNTVRQQLGNRPTAQVTAQEQYDTYTPGTGQLLHCCVGTAPVCTLVNLHYSYDGWGNLRTQQETIAAPGRTETFTYDVLHRLTKAQRPGGGANTAHYAYDDAGNLTRKSDYAHLYAYDSDRPHAVTSVTGPTPGSATLSTFEYDANGNQIAQRSFSNPGHVLRSVRYGVDNRPEFLRRVAQDSLPALGDTVFRYAPDGHRYLQYVRTNTQSNWTGHRVTLTPFEGYEIEAHPVQPQGQWQWSMNYQRTRQHLGDYAVRQTELGGVVPRIVWLHSDRLGSAVAKTNQNGTPIQHRDYPHPGQTQPYADRHGFDPFGKPRTGDWNDDSHGPGSSGILGSDVTPRGFTGHEHLDRSNEGYAPYRLIHMNGRMYDPLLGRFLSVDPIIQFPDNSQSLNPYSYIMNNPLAGTDPTGYAACGEIGFDKAGSGSCDVVLSDGSAVSVDYNVDGNGNWSLSMSQSSFNAIAQDNGARLAQAAVGMDRADGSTSGTPGATDIRLGPQMGPISTERPTGFAGTAAESRMSKERGRANSDAFTRWFGNLMAIFLPGDPKSVTGDQKVNPLTGEHLSADEHYGAIGDVMSLTVGAGAVARGAGHSVKRQSVPEGLSRNIHLGQQGKHTPGHPNFLSGRSPLAEGLDAQKLLDGVHGGSYPIIRITPRGQPVVDFRQTIGQFDGRETRYGVVNYGGRGAHIVPANPVQF